MLRVKNGGTATRNISLDETAEVSEAYIDFFTLPNKKVGYQILFTGPNPKWYESVLKKEAIPAVVKDGKEVSPAQLAEWDICQEPKTLKYGFFPMGEFEADHEGNLLLLCHEHALANKLKGQNWEIVNLNTV